MPQHIESADLIIIGAGPAGLFAAAQCAGLKVIVLEKNSTAGKKLLISGSGRCNITHEGPVSIFVDHYGVHGRFLKKSLHSFNNQDLVAFLHAGGLKTETDNNGKVFPATQRASDVLDLLISKCTRPGINIIYNQQADKIRLCNSHFEVQTRDRFYASRYLLISTGGMSYQATGSTGDGYRLAKELGHSVIPPKPSLSPVFIENYPFRSLAGVSVENKEISIYRAGRKVASHRGDIGFTHQGLSGPGILDFSRLIMAGDVLKINLLEINPDAWRNEIIELTTFQGKTLLVSYLRRFKLPRSLVLALLDSAGISHVINIGELTKEMRNSLVRIFCESPFTVSKVGGFNVAMVTAGGISLDEVSPATMESKLVQGLYFAGEVMDIDGDTGGYNLQAAFSTAFVAARQIMRLGIT